MFFMKNIPTIWMLTAESWVFGLGKAFCCEQILSTCHWNTPPKSFLIPTNTRERERWRGRERKRLVRIKLIGHILCLSTVILIHSAFWYNLKLCTVLKWFSSISPCFDPFTFIKQCLMPVIQQCQEFHFSFKPVVQNQQHLYMLAFSDYKRAPI